MSQEPATPADYGLNQSQIAALLHCSRRTIQRYLDSGRLKEYGNYGHRKVSARSVAEFLGTGQTPEQIRDLAQANTQESK